MGLVIQAFEGNERLASDLLVEGITKLLDICMSWQSLTEALIH